MGKAILPGKGEKDIEETRADGAEGLTGRHAPVPLARQVIPSLVHSEILITHRLHARLHCEHWEVGCERDGQDFYLCGVYGLMGKTINKYSKSF